MSFCTASIKSISVKKNLLYLQPVVQYQQDFQNFQEKYIDI